MYRRSTIRFVCEKSDSPKRKCWVPQYTTLCRWWFGCNLKYPISSNSCHPRLVVMANIHVTHIRKQKHKQSWTSRKPWLFKSEFVQSLSSLSVSLSVSVSLTSVPRYYLDCNQTHILVIGYYSHRASARAVCVVRLISTADTRTERLRTLLMVSNSHHCITCTVQ